MDKNTEGAIKNGHKNTEGAIQNGHKNTEGAIKNGQEYRRSNTKWTRLPTGQLKINNQEKLAT